MTLTCGVTSNGCNGKTGLIRVEYTIPESPYVRYRYPNENWVNVISGTRFENVLNPGEKGKCYTKYNVETEAQYRFTRGWEPEKIVTCRYRWTNLDGAIGAITSFKAGDLFGGNSSPPRVYLQYNGRPTNYIDALNYPYYVSQHIDWNYYNYNYTIYHNIISIIRADNQPDNCGISGTCTFKVFEVNNKILFQKTDTVCPTAEAMPSIYGNNKGSFNVKSIDEQPLKVINQEANNLKSTLIQLNNTTVKKLDSPSGATLFPRVCWDCDEDNCPDDTCEVECGSHICCYDKNGIAVKTILK